LTGNAARSTGNAAGLTGNAARSTDNAAGSTGNAAGSTGSVAGAIGAAPDPAGNITRSTGFALGRRTACAGSTIRLDSRAPRVQAPADGGAYPAGHPTSNPHRGAPMPINPSNWAYELQRILITYAVPIALKVLGAIVLWVIGRMVVGAVQGVADRGLENRKMDPTLGRYAHSVIGVTLTLLLVLAILSIFGVETTSFAGVLAAAGVAIGMAWSGLLSNFAAGVFLMVLRPFKVGDFVTVAGVTGNIKEIGLFASSVDTPDNIRTFIGNAKIFSDTIQNYTTNPYRRVDLKAQLAHSVDPKEAMAKLRERLPKIPNVMTDPAPSVELIDFTAMGPVLAVRPFCHNDHYWDVYFATNETIAAVCAEASYPVPEHRIFLSKAG
jgi:small conductance mechanosensitive channel